MTPHQIPGKTTTYEPTFADHDRYNELFAAWVDRDTEVDNFELQCSLIGLCERFGWDIPSEAR